MVTFSWLVDLQAEREELKFGMIINGTLYVMIPGAWMMQMLYVNNLDTGEQ